MVGAFAGVGDCAVEGLGGCGAGCVGAVRRGGGVSGRYGDLEFKPDGKCKADDIEAGA